MSMLAFVMIGEF